ncbi:MAG: TSUP family transporter, partial [Clostridia bacterium]|nr:TSUP family transporter [Clostridia bacterium]
MTWHSFLIVLPLVFAAATVDAIGGGGGLISLPAYLVAGLPSDLASGSNKLSACFGTAVATGKFLRSGKVLLKPALIAAALALPGAFLGAEI